jgi:hypothetical protein
MAVVETDHGRKSALHCAQDRPVRQFLDLGSRMAKPACFFNFPPSFLQLATVVIGWLYMANHTDANHSPIHC